MTIKTYGDLVNQIMSPKKPVVTVHAVQNGYQVITGGGWNRDCRVDSDDHVFESFEALTAYLRGVMPLFPVAVPTLTTTATKKRKPTTKKR